MTSTLICHQGSDDTNAFSRSTDKIQVLNELPTDTRHTQCIKVPQDMSYTRRQQETSFQKILLKYVTRPDLSGIPL